MKIRYHEFQMGSIDLNRPTWKNVVIFLLAALTAIPILIVLWVALMFFVLGSNPIPCFVFVLLTWAVIGIVALVLVHN